MERATLVGSPTAGAVVAANEYDLPDGWSMVLPCAWLNSGLGTKIEGRGVTPDVYSGFSAPDTEPLSVPEIAELLATH